MRSSALLFVTLIVFCGSLMPATVNGQGVFEGPYTTTQKTNNQTDDTNVQINTSGWLAWSGNGGINLWNGANYQVLPNSSGAPLLSDNGYVAWSTGNIYRWDGVNTVLIDGSGICASPSINASGDVAYYTYQRYNTPSIRTSWGESYQVGDGRSHIEQVQTNNNRQLVYQYVTDISTWYFSLFHWVVQTPTTVISEGYNGGPWNPVINDENHVAYKVASSSMTYGPINFWNGTNSISIPNSNDGLQLQLNNNDKVVWKSDNGISYWDGVFTRVLPNSTGGTDPQINDRGQVAWSKTDGIYLYNGFTTARVASVQNPSAVKLNEKGQLAWTASDGTDSEVFVAGPHSPPTPDNAITIQPFTRPTGSTAKNAIVLVHGWKDNPSLFTTTNVDPGNLTTTNMKAHIEQALAQSGLSSDWDVIVYDWSTDAANTSGTIAPSESCKSKAGLQGQYLANQLKANGYGVDSGSQVHFVAHSLGSKVIDEATRILSTYKDKQQFEGAIQETFLDAYTPSDWRFKFGEKATYAEHYFYNKDTFADSYYGHTADTLTHAYNEDISSMIDYVGSESQNHKWPVRFYDNTISSQTPIGGFQYSKESGFYSTWTHPEQNGQQTTTVKTSINPQESFFGGSETGNYTISPEHITGSTGSPLWINLLLNTQGFNNYLEFNFAFTSNADGVLSVFLDDHLLGQFFERYAPEGDQSSGKMWLEELLPEGSHLLSFRLDPMTADTSSIDISQIELGHMTAVPEPASITLLTMGFACFLAYRIRRRARP